MRSIEAKHDDDGKVLKLYAKACDRGHAGGCAALGAIYLDGKNTNRDFLKAAEAFKKACDEGNALGCHKLGELRENEDRRNSDKALEYYRKACGLKEQRSCESYSRLMAASAGCGVINSGQAKAASHGSGPVILKGNALVGHRHCKTASGPGYVRREEIFPAGNGRQRFQMK